MLSSLRHKGTRQGSRSLQQELLSEQTTSVLLNAPDFYVNSLNFTRKSRQKMGGRHREPTGWARTQEQLHASPVPGMRLGRGYRASAGVLMKGLERLHCGYRAIPETLSRESCTMTNVSVHGKLTSSLTCSFCEP